MVPAASLTVVILTKNEQENIADCLRCVAWAESVLIIDSFSTDQTLNIARDIRPDLQILQNHFEDFGQQRNFALDQPGLKAWILFLDADERCTPELEREIRTVIDQKSETAGYFLTCRNLFLGKWIRRCTLYPSWQLRLLRHGKVRYRKEGHGQREVTEGELGYMKHPYDHLGFSQGIAHWVARHNRYSTDEVELIMRLREERLCLSDLFQRDPVMRRRSMKRLAARTGLLRPFFRFVYLYVLQLGFLDGYPGLIFCLLRLAHEIHIVAKLAEAQSVKSCSSVRIGSQDTTSDQ